MDLQLENFRSDPLSDPATRYPGVDRDAQEPRPGSPLDGEQATRLHGKLLGIVQYEKTRQAPNRYQMARDCDYYDSIQFTDEDLQELAERGQAPLVYNLSKRVIDWVIGTERRTRFDFKVLGRTEDDVKNARIKTDVMKYVQDVNRTQFHRSAAFKEAAIAGVGWLEDGVRAEPDELPIYSRKESWWYTLHDSHSMELDYTDARYHTRWRYVDTDLAVAMFPQREPLILSSALNGNLIDERLVDEWYLGNRLTGEDYAIGKARHNVFSSMEMIDSGRERVKVFETWFKKPVRESVMISRNTLPMMHGQPYDPSNDDMRHAVLIGDATTVDRLAMRVFYALYTETGMLAMGRSPYRHNEFPFTPIWCYRRGRDNAPYGMIRTIRDPQDGFNRRMAKSIFALSAYRVEAESNAIDEKIMGWEDVRQEAGRPDALIVRKPGSKIEVVQDRALGDEHFKIAQAEANLVLESSGVTGENLGVETNAQSGKAIIAKQSEGAAVTAEVFDNVRLAAQLQGEKQLSLAEQFLSEETVIRVTDSRGRPSWKKVNEIVTDPQTGEARVLNDITASKADFIIDQQNFHASMRQAAYEALVDAAGKLGANPMVALQIMELAFDSSDLPNKDDVVKRLRSITGYSDPNEAQTPEEQAELQQAQQAQAQQQQKAQQQADAAFDADIQNKLAEAQKKRAEARKTLIEAVEKKLQILNGGGDAAQEGQAEADEAAASQRVKDLEAEVESLTKQLQDKEADRQNKLDVAKVAASAKAPAPDELQQAVADLFGEFEDMKGVMAKFADLLKQLTPQQPAPPAP